MERRRRAQTLLHLVIFLCLVIVNDSHEDASLGKEEYLNSAQRLSKEGVVCPAYGCPLLPRDVAFDEVAKDALAALRAKKGKGDKSNPIDLDDVAADVRLKAFDALKSSGSEHAATLTLVGYKGGAVADQINQDRAFVISPFNAAGSDGKIEGKVQDYKILGVFDGHAQHGEIVSEYALQQVPKLIASKLYDMLKRDGDIGRSKDDGNTEGVKKILTDTFIEIDRAGQTDLSIPSGGCTATVVLQIGPMVFVANAGDSRSFVATYTKSTGAVDVVYSTREDKPHLPDERERVEKMGGRIYLPDDDRESTRVYYIDASGQRHGGLAMSRSLGDYDLGKRGVIPDPLVDTIYIPDIVAKKVEAGSACQENEEKCSALSEDEDDVHVFAISATDGLLDYIAPEEIAEAVAEGLFADDGNLFTACQDLIFAAAKGWYGEFEYQYRDDIAIAVSKITMH